MSSSAGDEKAAALTLCIDALLSFQAELLNAAEADATAERVLEIADEFDKRVETSIHLLEADQAKLLTSFLHAVRQVGSKESTVERTWTSKKYLKDRLASLVSNLRGCLSDIGIKLKTGVNGLEWELVDAQVLRQERGAKVHEESKMLAEELKVKKSNKEKLLKEVEQEALQNDDEGKVLEVRDQMGHITRSLSWITK